MMNALFYPNKPDTFFMPKFSTFQYLEITIAKFQKRNRNYDQRRKKPSSHK